MTTLAFTVPGAPVPCARARVVRGHAFTPDRTTAYEQRVALVARAVASRARWSPPPGAAFELRLDVHRAARRGDFDNFAKAVADALTKAGVWGDDRRVEVAVVRLYIDRANPRADVEVRIIEPHAGEVDGLRGADVDRGRVRGSRNDLRVVRETKTRPRVTGAAR